MFSVLFLGHDQASTIVSQFSSKPSLLNKNLCIEDVNFSANDWFSQSRNIFMYLSLQGNLNVNADFRKKLMESLTDAEKLSGCGFLNNRN